MAAFPPYYTTATPTYITGTTATANTGWSTSWWWRTRFDQATFAELPGRAVPIGKPIAMPVQTGIWIAEKTPGAKKRKVIDVVCGSHILCEGKRHSIIAWKNLGRYIEVSA